MNVLNRALYRIVYTDHISNVAVEIDIQLPSIVSPWSELHRADLYVEREIEDINRAGWAKDGGR